MAQHQNNLFLNTTVVVSLGDWFNIITYFIKQALFIYFIYSQQVSLKLHPAFVFHTAYKSFMLLYSHPTHHFKVNCKTNRLAIIYIVLYKSIC